MTRILRHLSSSRFAVPRLAARHDGRSPRRVGGAAIAGGRRWEAQGGPGLRSRRGGAQMPFDLPIRLGTPASRVASFAS